MTLRQVLYWLLYWLRCGPIQCLSEYSKYIKHMAGLSVSRNEICEIFYAILKKHFKAFKISLSSFRFVLIFENIWRRSFRQSKVLSGRPTIPSFLLLLSADCTHVTECDNSAPFGSKPEQPPQEKPKSCIVPDIKLPDLLSLRMQLYTSTWCPKWKVSSNTMPNVQN